MTRVQKNILWVLVILNIAFFLAFIPSNKAASKDIAMVTIFEPDEGVPLPYVFNMIKPAPSLKEALIDFAFYKYYFYGFPYFAYSALLLIPLQAAAKLADLSLVMAVLRQMVSVLPMLLAIDLLVYLQTRFKNYKAILLFLLLASLPAVVQNNLWWHPDGLAILFAMLVIFFLDKDELRFGSSFYLAAAACGFSAGTKGTGFYFFLTIFVYLLIGFIQKKAHPGKLMLAAFGFLAVMAGAYLLVNPTLIFSGVRKDYFQVMSEQANLLTQGYAIAYPKGLGAVLPQVKKDYASIPFLAGILGLNIWGMIKGRKRLLNTIIFTWFLPTTMLVFFMIHYKYQYWLPVALPFYSITIDALPDRIDLKKAARSHKAALLAGMLCVAIILCQTLVNIRRDIIIYAGELTREEDSAAIRFSREVENALAPLPADRNVHILSDVRIYLPPHEQWYSEATFELPDYNFITQKDFDVLLIMQQRVYDYLNENITGLDQAEFSKNQAFYQDARAGTIKGYHLIHKGEFGLIFISEDLYQKYW
jgi:hypothetical protein